MRNVLIGHGHVKQCLPQEAQKEILDFCQSVRADLAKQSILKQKQLATIQAHLAALEAQAKIPKSSVLTMASIISNFRNHVTAIFSSMTADAALHPDTYLSQLNLLLKSLCFGKKVL